MLQTDYTGDLWDITDLAGIQHYFVKMFHITIIIWSSSIG